MSRCRQLAAVTVALVAVAVAAVPAGAGRGGYARPLVYVVVLDGMDGDRVDSGGAPFISAMLAGQAARATYYRESRSVIVAETNPNHVAMMTGAYGGESGIPANAFALYSPLENEDSCRATGPVDESKRPTETTGESAHCPIAETVFGSLKRQAGPGRLITAGVFGKPKLGRLFAGKNTSHPGRRDIDYLWAPCASGPDDDDYCADVPTNPATGYAVDDATVMDAVLSTITEGVPAGGETRRPDFTFVNLHQIDSAGHGLTTGPAYDLAIRLADQEVERLISTLRARGEWTRTVLILLSDHSLETTLTKVTLQETLTDAGIAESDFLVVDNGSIDFIYLTNRQSPDRFSLLRRMREAAMANPNVAEALYREPNPLDGSIKHHLDAVHPAWHFAGPRTGDLVVLSKPGSAFSDPSPSSNPVPGNHGAPQTRDNFFAVISGGDFVRHQTIPGVAHPPYFDDTLLNPDQSENVDVAPTVMGLFGLFAPRDSAGRFLQEAFDLARLPGGGAAERGPRLTVRATTSTFRDRRRGIATYRLQWSPSGGRYDLRVRRGRRGRPYVRILSGIARNEYLLRAHRGARYAIGVRSILASGVPTPWTVRTLRPRRLR